MEPTPNRLIKLWVEDIPDIYIVVSDNGSRVVVRNAKEHRLVYTLVKRGDQWIVEGDTTNTPVYVYEGITFTGVDNVDANILANVDDDLLEATCAVDIRVKAICDSNYFWLLKMKKLDSRVNIPSSYRGSYKKLYREALTEISLGQSLAVLAAKEGLVDMFLSYPIEQRVRGTLTPAADHGHLDIVKMIAGYGVPLTDGDASHAANEGHLDVVEWIYETAKILPAQPYFNQAVGRGHQDVVDWLLDKGFKPTTSTADIAARYCNLPALVWLASQDIYPAMGGIQEAQRRNCLDVLKWLYIKGKLNRNDISLLLLTQGGSVDAFKWVAETFGIYPEQDTINNLLTGGRLDVLDWAVGVTKIVPTSDTSETVISGGSLAGLKWLEQHNLFDPYVEEIGSLVSAIDKAITRRNFDTVHWLEEKGVLTYDQDLIDVAVSENYLDVVVWLVEKKHLWPSQEVLIRARGDPRYKRLSLWLDTQRRVGREP